MLMYIEEIDPNQGRNVTYDSCDLHFGKVLGVGVHKNIASNLKLDEHLLCSHEMRGIQSNCKVCKN